MIVHEYNQYERCKGFGYLHNNTHMGAKYSRAAAYEVEVETLSTVLVSSRNNEYVR
jgi:hypothetical protein